MVARSSGLMLSDQTAQVVLELLTATAVQTVTSSSGAGITLTAPDGKPMTAAGTDALVERADALQYELDEGPCLTAWHEQRTIRVADLAAEERWPRWARAAVDMGIRSVLSSALVVGARSVGALKLYAREPEAFSGHDEATASLFAAQSAILVDSARTFRNAGELSDELRDMLHKRDAVTRATGLIMGRDRVPEDIAFGSLISLAKRQGRSVHSVAARLLSSQRTGR